MKIAVMGGAFNPIHNGHIELANSFSEQLQFDKLLLVPTKISPHKSSDKLISSEHRLIMCERAAAEIRNGVVSDIEIKRQGVSFTYQTLEQLSDIYPKAELFFICGSDMFTSLHRWRNPERIISLSTICTVRRSNEPLSKIDDAKKRLSSMGAKIIIADFVIPAFSSTEIRNLISDKKDVSSMLSGDVYKYIKDNNLYLP